MRRALFLAVLFGSLALSLSASADLLLLGVGSQGGTPPSGCMLVTSGSLLLNTTGSCLLIH